MRSKSSKQKPVALAHKSSFLEAVGSFHNAWSGIEFCTDFAIYKYLSRL